MNPLFTLTVFSSAFLLLLIQPMIAKLMLPHVGGAPAMWVTAMLFFQTVLLAGYGYVALTSRYLGSRTQWALHLGLFTVALWVTMPLSLQPAADLSPTDAPVQWVLQTLLSTIGLPYFVLSASSSLLQRWYHAGSGKEPYFLFSASNAGSLLGLFSYPLWVEWSLGLSEQLTQFSLAFAGLYGLFILIFIGLKRRHTLPDQKQEAVTSGLALRAILLAFLPSALFLALTLYITTDIAAFPLLWVIPLALYLLSFVIVFARWGERWSAIAQKLHPLALLLFVVTLFAAAHPIIMLSHFLIFLLVSVSCHGQLARIRPQPQQLTAFFFWVSLGGALGGLANLLMPYLLNNSYEYPVLMLLSMLALPAKHGLAQGIEKLKQQEPKKLIAGILLFTLPLGVIWSTHEATPSKETESLLYQSRNFYGVSKVYLHQQGEIRWHQFLHGTTNHGFQMLEGENRLKPVSYYAPISRLLDGLPDRFFAQPFAFMGLGAGTMACYGRAGQAVDFFEIDAAVVSIARNPSLFTYLRDCPPDANVILGDARVQLSQQPADKHYQLIAMDAFSSDSVPMHLITKEAIAQYQKHLVEKEGIIAVHISNRYFALAPFIIRIAQELRLKSYHYPSNQKARFPEISSEWVILTSAQTPWDETLQKHGFTPVTVDASTPLWTDDYAYVPAALRPGLLNLGALLNDD